ncbi:DUF2750 domain-containing protein [Ferrimonas pelagia]|uniref:DUF2750 domain-containing protein n=1 Tax=Ferrimonas pelagia TaxID=1177826 RepID=A0ABP9ET54_9GAMM
MSADQIKAFYSQNSQERYDVVVEAAKANQKLWTLADDNGCVVLDSGTEQCLVVWHDEAIAADWGKGDFDGCKTVAISLSDFIEKWAPGMTDDGFDIAVAPSLAGEGIVLAAQELADELS